MTQRRQQVVHRRQFEAFLQDPSLSGSFAIARPREGIE